MAKHKKDDLEILTREFRRRLLKFTRPELDVLADGITLQELGLLTRERITPAMIAVVRKYKRLNMNGLSNKLAQAGVNIPEEMQVTANCRFIDLAMQRAIEKGFVRCDDDNEHQKAAG